MLTLNGLSFAYSAQGPLFTGLNARVEAGQVLAIIGRNGAGKSTLLRLLNGLLRPDTGEVTVHGRSTAGLKVHEIARDVGTLFQTPEQQLFAARVYEEVAFEPKQRRLADAEVKGRVDDALQRTFLSDQAQRHPLDLSMAERRFTALASILAMHPAVLLLDEPQRGLDRLWTERLEAIIASERAAGKAIVLICHDMDFVDRNAQIVLALGTGDTPVVRHVDDVFRDPHLLRQASVDTPSRIRLASLDTRRAAMP
ncbi:MAG TPA: ABC transporter ATP-binding protein [Shinella sp.]|jgi:energy-coupling factor transport system ATP-binding protein|uniref:energy-coupling factor ABC transporter ATP-binding protein n=1 Tax=Shinella sp. TaxID=1870904 RepID=UPI002E13E5A8|nr:ABC transporter ATP-binding protein [Shinella sp.]